MRERFEREYMSERERGRKRFGATERKKVRKKDCVRKGIGRKQKERKKEG